ncbi:MAG TPA: deoxyribonuclease IV [Gemmataceae bacterium]|nr:deoxyribonuclease IV [Gemmataceae bacterium]
MPPLGAHQSIAGGVHNALLTAARLGCETVQMFTKNTNQWAARPLSPLDIDLFRKALRQTRLRFPTAHDSYLINLASPNPGLWRKSVEAFVDELDRAAALGLKYLVTHPGAHTGAGEEAGLALVVRALDEVHTRRPKVRVKVLLEITAGQGSCLGHRFDHLGSIIGQVNDPRQLGVCFDTCHAIAAGYALGSATEYEATFREFDRVIGLRRLKLFHLNDSKKPLGSRVDRHEHIGKGCLGLEPFRRLVNDPRFEKTPMILETPKHDPHGNEMDPVNLSVLRGLRVKS